MLAFHPIPAFKDNYIWLITRADTPYAVIVDPGAARPVLDALNRLALIPVAILVTHHHWDHTSGIAELLEHHRMPVYGPAGEAIPCITHRLREDDQVGLPEPGLDLNVLDVPGHTRGAIAFYGHDALLCGDTLFTAGCGRLFEGSAEQMHASLMKFSMLSDATQVYCGHEYTLANLDFASVVEPANPDIRSRRIAAENLRARGIPTVPGTLALEKNTNPFMRCYESCVIEAAQGFAGRKLSPGAEVFATIRHWKDTLDD